MSEPIAVKMAYEVIELYEENMRLRSENGKLKDYRKKYDELLISSVNHSGMMMGRFITALIEPESFIGRGVTDETKVSA